MRKRRSSVQDHIRAGIPDEVLEEIFPKKLKRYGA
jgi:hypothetical protein